MVMCNTDATTVTMVRNRMTVLANAVPLAAKWNPTSMKMSNACTGAVYLAITHVLCSMTPQIKIRIKPNIRNSTINVAC